MSSSRSRRSGDGQASVSRGPQGGKDHTYLTVKMPSSKLRQATSHRSGSSIAVNSDTAPKRSTRGGKKSYVVESDSDEEEEEGEDEIQVGAPVVAGDDEDEDMDGVEDDDAEGEEVEDDMDVDAEGEDDQDADGDEDDVAPTPGPVIKISKATKKSPESKKTKNATPQKATVQFSAPNDSDDDELSELESDEEMDIEGEEDAEGEEDDEDVDAEGDDIEEDQEAEAEPEPDAEAAPRPEDLGSDDEDNGSRGGTPDFTRMTVRQRARFEEVDSSHYQALSNEVQAKKHFTAEEKAMRRAEMARRRRNLSEKRNEEVKQETINKLLKKQASKTNRKGLQAIGEEGQDADGFKRPNPVFIHWVSRREGERIAIPGEILEGPAGRLFANSVRPSGAGPTGLAGPKKMVEEVS
ncbi:Ino eighty subunit 2 [Cytospora mali]|uniref:Ino eighty subunit 2 n=1 Tax=Cytospora mali TaxID=578113 RepID=A0A194VV07_CYTMA|nr:Ino eighty subunit 2 [Valsa mali]